LLDSGAWFYEVYETADNKFVSFGAIDPKASAELASRLGLADAVFDRDSWPAMKQRVAERVKTKTRDEWAALLEGTDVCFAPVLEPDEAPQHPHHRARATFTEVGGVVQPSPAPRFSRTPPAVAGPPPKPGEHTDAALADWGFSSAEIARLRESGAIR